MQVVEAFMALNVNSCDVEKC